MVRDKTGKVDATQFVRGFEYPAKSLKFCTLEGEKPQETEIIAYSKARRCRCSPLNRRTVSHSIWLKQHGVASGR